MIYYSSVPKEINFTAPYERQIVHFVPEVDSLYNYEIAGDQISYGFFAKLTAFFRGLFGSLPEVEIKP